jgi:protein-S-isoprenylcysteine O-methyltransferase Ste14
MICDGHSASSSTQGSRRLLPENGMNEATSPVSGAAKRTLADLLLLGVTLFELALLFPLTSSFGLADWIYVLQHLIVLGIALTRRSPQARDNSVASGIAIVVAYGYSYAQVAYLKWNPGQPAWEAGGLVLVTLGAFLSFASLLTLGRLFGVRPALRGLVTTGPYRLVRHPMYLAYLIADIGYNLEEWNPGTLLLVALGWGSLVYRIRAEERILALHADWPGYVARVRYRLLPRVW